MYPIIKLIMNSQKIEQTNPQIRNNISGSKANTDETWHIKGITVVIDNLINLKSSNNTHTEDS